MLKTKNRKEITLDDQTVSLLQMKADIEGRKLKNYMERVLTETANDFALSDEYKTMMDGLLDKHQSGELNFLSEEEFKAQTARK
ncbi:hypothetical protein [Jiulongibacter sediminis]|uniref:CopG family transcriptional regulator n=1 Tax=Jiulongibacter sediminis TaxID=1605367 RepID=A0A0P7BDA3_9BACT|nr:hypothetical protein [Jiulongibacter sediminis]KPM48677.1 hypothetical protein AFM12_08765 [Jiulongibacter sediminis]TBX25212.1 hypothetical protein TK44_08770 [Jiulongibacter sediminis]